MLVLIENSDDMLILKADVKGSFPLNSTDFGKISCIQYHQIVNNFTRKNVVSAVSMCIFRVSRKFISEVH
jgi:hypothetical protein